MFFCSPVFRKWSLIFRQKSVLSFSQAIYAQYILEFWEKVTIILITPKISILKNKIYKDVYKMCAHQWQLNIHLLIYIQAIRLNQKMFPKSLYSVSHLPRSRQICIYRASSCSQDMFSPCLWFGFNFGLWKTGSPYESVCTSMLGCVVLRYMTSGFCYVLLQKTK